MGDNTELWFDRKTVGRLTFGHVVWAQKTQNGV